MSDAAWALQTARQVGPVHPPHAHPHPIHKLHTGPLHSHVAGRTDHLPSNVPNGAYVLPADIVSALGEGNTMAGFKIAKRMFEGAGRHFYGMPYAGDNGPYGQGAGLPYAVGHAKGGSVNDPAKYRGEHEAPDRECGAPMHDTSGIWPADFHGPNGFRYYADFGNPYDMEGYSKIRSVRNHPARPVTVYRAVPKDAPNGINPGDWVTQTRAYAKEHGDANLGGPGKYKILSKQARARDLFTSGDVHEWGYNPQPYNGIEERQYKALNSGTAPYAYAKGGQITIGRNEKQTTVGPGYEEWQTQPLNGVVNDPQNAVTGPIMPQGPSFQDQLEDSRNRQDIIDQHVGTPLADGGMAANPAFNNWFSGSRVVDENGAPAPQYHSTTGDFSTFRTGPGNGLKLMDGLGAHFGTAEAANQRFKKNYGKAPPPGGNVMPVYLSIKKPLTKKDGSPMNEGELQSHLSKVASQIGIDKNKHRAYSAAYPMRGDIYRQLKDELVRRGYDGIPYVNSHEDRGSTSWIAFHPNQIKSATGNQGTFDPSNPDITKAAGGSVDQGVPVAVAGGEHVLAPHEVMFAGMGDLDAGHRALDDFVIRQRAKTVKTLKGLPGPKRD